MAQAKLEWTPVNLETSHPTVKAAIAKLNKAKEALNASAPQKAVNTAKDELEAIITKRLADKVPEGQVVKVFTNMAWGTVSYAFAPAKGKGGKGIAL